MSALIVPHLAVTTLLAMAVWLFCRNVLRIWFPLFFLKCFLIPLTARPCDIGVTQPDMHSTASARTSRTTAESNHHPAGTMAISCARWHGSVCHTVGEDIALRIGQTKVL